jgi:hypothetical protein
VSAVDAGVGEDEVVSRRLEIGACRSVCAWSAVTDTPPAQPGAEAPVEPLFRCAGCGSEWLPSEPWTPIDWTGQVPEAVQRARTDRRARGAG